MSCLRPATRALHRIIGMEQAADVGAAGCAFRVRCMRQIT
jgi:hypothetical protein